MPSKSLHLVRWGVFVAAGIVLALCGFAARFSSQFFDAASWVNHTTEVIGQIRATRRDLGLPGAFLPGGGTSSEQVGRIQDDADRVAALVQDNPRQERSIHEFKSLIAGMPLQHGRNGLDDATFESAYSVLDRMQNEEYTLLAQRTRVQSEATRSAGIAISALCLALLALGLVTALAARREFHRREQAEARLVGEKQELTRFTSELALVSVGSELIQTAADENKVNEAVAKVMNELAQDSHGYFGLIAPSNDLVEVCSSWGNVPPPASFPPADCSALQLGHQVHSAESLVSVRCAHCANETGEYLCMPVRSASGHLGLLHLSCSQPLTRKTVDAVSLFAAQVGLGLANLRMREALRSQSVRDSLTGLFNRRYFDETLDRELAASQRSLRPLSVLMLDMDHFKYVNDTFGHGAGDEALRIFARLMRSSFRESDVVCRYGGEEFAVIMIDASRENAFARAEALRIRVEQTDFGAPGHSMGKLTTSIGLASSDDFPAARKLVLAADAALYRAKQSGRNMSCAQTRPEDHMLHEGLA